MLDVSNTSRAFTRGFDVRTSIGTFSAKKVRLSPKGEFRIFNDSGDQIERMEYESFFCAVYNIIITGGGFYQFERSRDSSREWTCKGEGRLLRISEREKRKFDLFAEAQIAECSKSRLFNHYEIRVFSDADLKLAICVFLALSLLEHQSDPAIPD